MAGETRRWAGEHTARRPIVVGVLRLSVSLEDPGGGSSSVGRTLEIGERLVDRVLNDLLSRRRRDRRRRGPIGQSLIDRLLDQEVRLPLGRPVGGGPTGRSTTVVCWGRSTVSMSTVCSVVVVGRCFKAVFMSTTMKAIGWPVRDRDHDVAVTIAAPAAVRVAGRRRRGLAVRSGR